MSKYTKQEDETWKRDVDSHFLPSVVGLSQNGDLDCLEVSSLGGSLNVWRVKIPIDADSINSLINALRDLSGVEEPEKEKPKFDWKETSTDAILEYEGHSFYCSKVWNGWDVNKVKFESGYRLHNSLSVNTSLSQAKAVCENWLRKNVIEKMNEPIEAPENTWVRFKENSICFIDDNQLEVIKYEGKEEWFLCSDICHQSGNFPTREEAETELLERYREATKTTPKQD